KHDLQDEQTFAGYRNLLVESLYNAMLNNRLEELLNNPEPPYLFGFSTEGRFIRSKEFYMLGAAVKDNGINQGLATLLVEANRVKKYGFTESELAREKAEMLRGIEQAYNERDKTESNRYAAEYGRNFLEGEPIPGIEAEFELYKQFIPDIGLEEINKLADQWITDSNRVVLVSAPEKEGIVLPTEDELRTVFDEANRKDVTPYEDRVPQGDLVTVPPTPGRIVDEKKIEPLEVTEWTLSNGIKVISKPTDFKNDEVLFTSYSPGGHSLIDDAHFVAATTAGVLVREGGVGPFDQITLRKSLSGKIVSVSPWINSLQEGISGSASPQDLETMFQLIYLYFTAPRRDSTAFLSFQSRIKGFIQNRHASPDAAFQDTVQTTMSSYHFRARPWSPAVLDEMNLDKSFRIYQDRFADASDFSFFFVGNFDYAKLKPLVETYLGGLPSMNRTEHWVDRDIEAPKGVIEKEVVKGLEPKSRVSMIFTGPFVWNRQNRYVLNSMAAAFKIKLREVLREDMGGTYGVGIWASTSRYPDQEYSLNITFGCSPERVDELTESVFTQIDSLKSYGIPESYLAKVKENQRRERETSLRQNRYWLNSLRSKYYHDEDPLEILQFDEQLDLLTFDAVQSAAKRYFNLRNYVKVSLIPEGS
ncbi:insulinase family protein, partial [bacterium]|nr:insulinase family protein [bacterium]